MRREDQGRSGHRGQAPRDGLAQQVGTTRPAIVEDVAPLGVQHRKMHMHPVARVLRIGFGHEGGGKAVLARQPAHQALEQPRVVGTAHGVLVVEIDLELPHATFGYRRLGRNAHRLATAVEVGEIGVESVHFGHRQHRLVDKPAPGQRVDRRAGGLASGIEQGEFQLGCRHHAPTPRCIAVQHRRQRVARIAVERASAVVEHLHRNQGGRALDPGHRHCPTISRPQDPVRIAAVEQQRAAGDVGAPQVDIQRRERHPHRTLVQLGPVGTGHALAAHLPVQVAGGDAKGL